MEPFSQSRTVAETFCSPIMQLVLVYAIWVGSTITALLVLRYLPLLRSWASKINRINTRYIVNSIVISRHRFGGPYALGEIILCLLFVATNVFFVWYPDGSLESARGRCGILALANMGFLYASPSMSSLSDLLGLRLRVCRQLHCGSGWMACAHISFHILFNYVNRNLGSIRQTSLLLGVIVRVNTFICFHLLVGLWVLVNSGPEQGSASILCMLILCLPIIRRYDYPIFYVSHYLLAALVASGVVLHLPHDSVDAWRLFYVIAALFGANTLMKIGAVLHRNGVFANSWSHGDVIKHDDCSMRIEIRPGRPVTVQPGQYIDLWVPSWNPWSWFQSASFIVTSWSTEKQSTLQIYSKCPNRPLGFTWLLLWRALRNSRRNLVFFSGPHGISVPASHYETVLLVASDSGILAMRPYVDQLFHCVTKRTSKTRRLCLVWNVTRRSSNHFVSDIFGWVNKLLLNDIKDHTNMLSVKIYNAQGVLKTRPGENGSRGEVIQKPADLPALSSLLAEEVQAHQERITTDDMKERGEMLVMASASGQIIDNLRQSVKAYLTWVHLVELDYQPTVNSTPGPIRRQK